MPRVSRTTAIVVGVEPNPGEPPYALLAREEDGQLIYAGSALVTLPTKARDHFWETAEALKIDRPCGEGHPPSEELVS